MKRKMESSSVGTLPPVHVTCWIDRVLAASRLPARSRFQPGAASNESIEKPSGTVSSIVGGRRALLLGRHGEGELLSTFALATGGLTIACANAGVGEHASASAAAASAATECAGLNGYSFRFVRLPG